MIPVLSPCDEKRLINEYTRAGEFSIILTIKIVTVMDLHTLN